MLINFRHFLHRMSTGPVLRTWKTSHKATRLLNGYTTERTTWFKIKNRNYSQMAGREELFERERHKEPVAGWHCCEL